MRLIDTDKLKIRNVSADYWYTVMGVTEDDIDNAPTVKAIPIDYIEKWIDARARIIKINPPAFRELLATKLLDDWLAGREPAWSIKFEVEENAID